MSDGNNILDTDIFLMKIYFKYYRYCVSVASLILLIKYFNLS